MAARHLKILTGHFLIGTDNKGHLSFHEFRNPPHIANVGRHIIEIPSIHPFLVIGTPHVDTNNGDAAAPFFRHYFLCGIPIFFFGPDCFTNGLLMLVQQLIILNRPTIYKRKSFHEPTNLLREISRLFISVHAQGAYADKLQEWAKFVAPAHSIQNLYPTRMMRANRPAGSEKIKIFMRPEVYNPKTRIKFQRNSHQVNIVEHLISRPPASCICNNHKRMDTADAASTVNPLPKDSQDFFQKQACGHKDSYIPAEGNLNENRNQRERGRAARGGHPASLRHAES